MSQRSGIERSSSNPAVPATHSESARLSEGPSREAGRQAGPPVGPPPAGPDRLTSGQRAALKAREWRESHPDRWREIAREAARRRRLRAPDAIREANLKHRQLHRDRARARARLFAAIRRGKIHRPDHCSRCTKLCVPHGHHADYSRPLDVTWLCRDCHWNEHRAERERELGAA